MFVGFSIEARAPDCGARAGRLVTRQGEVPTPVFMPVGTQATVRAQGWEGIRSSGSRILLANTYHLMRRPGPEVLERFGGIRGFIGKGAWDGAVLTDSGGYQVFSLADRLWLDEQGARFRLEGGSEVVLTPERSIEIQQSIGSDIMMAFDQCLPSTAPRAQAEEAMARTHRWARRSLAARDPSRGQALFGIVQGACFEDLRRASAAEIGSLPFDGFAIGGLAVGETRQQRRDITELTAGLLPESRPRYLMGVGTPADLLEGVSRGVDMFDCILPTAFAQQGLAFTSRGRVDLRRGVYRMAEKALDPACSCPSCLTHSRAYLHHLIKAREILGWQLVGLHNLYFYHRLMSDARERIVAGAFASWASERIRELDRADEDNPVVAPRRGRSGRPAPRLGAYEVVDSPAGFSRIRHAPSGEVMHPSRDPQLEAQSLYVEQSRLPERLASGEDVVVWDVGLGAATNAMAALRCREPLGPTAGKLRVVSFENDLDSLRLALKHAARFPHLRHRAPGMLLEEGRYSGAGTEWTLVFGDFGRELARAPIPDIVFYDPFSFRTDSALWSTEHFSVLRQAWMGARVGLFTYSASTAVRASLMRAGFWVARGAGTGSKTETTVALTPEAARKDSARYDMLGSRWLERWKRSAAREMPPAMAAPLEEHPQFLPLLLDPRYP